jgi:CheY-like chemotaxis protein
MNNTQSIAPHLPYLRRYARAVTGSQSSGDGYVRAALSAILAGDQVLAQSVSARVGLYQVFHAIWSSASGHIDNEIPLFAEAKLANTPEERLAMLDAEKRAVLILTAVEGFRVDETALIVGGTPNEVERALVDAQETIDRQLTSRVLIIEDEPIIAIDLHNLVTEMGHEVVGIAATRDQAVSTALEKRPGLVLADVNLGEGGSGVDAVKQILDSFDVPVIFVTAYPEKLLTGERPEPTYLVAKPFLPETIRATVGQALFLHETQKFAA